MIAPLPKNEAARLEALRQYEILDTDSEEVFDDLTRLAAYICQTPIAVISLVDKNRQWFKARLGLEARETSRDCAFCAHAILEDAPLVVPDALADERFADNSLVTSEPYIRLYAGAPLLTPEGFRLGTLCVIDRVARSLSGEQVAALRMLANQVMAQFDLRRDLQAVTRSLTEHKRAEKELKERVGQLEANSRSKQAH
ncbi:MAG: GAF domain-containing protein [Pyrinomonadaceae bacterium]|nr:GAF domain-containing protein [Pyrinomonadaceae bacterium]